MPSSLIRSNRPKTTWLHDVIRFRIKIEGDFEVVEEVVNKRERKVI
jgi:hypothetical protein